MKNTFTSRNHSHTSGFTLVELLVVIGIIAILAAVLTTAAGFAIKAAQRARANNLGSQIQTGAMAYYTEYSVYPVPTATTTDLYYSDTGATDGTNWQYLICMLSGNVRPSDGTAKVPAAAGPGPYNNRNIAFLSLRANDVFTAKDVAANANGVQDAPKNPLPTSNTAALFFNITFDSDYSGVMGDSTSFVKTKLPNFQLSSTTAMDYTGTSTAGIAVWANCNGSTNLNPGFWVHTY